MNCTEKIVICIGVNKDLRSVWISQGDDEVEALTVEIWADDFPVRVVTAYGPKLGDSHERNESFGSSLKERLEILMQLELDLSFKWIVIVMLGKI